MKYEQDLGHVIITFIGLKIPFRNMGTHGVQSLIYRLWVLKTPQYPMSDWVNMRRLYGLIFFCLIFSPYLVTNYQVISGTIGIVFVINIVTYH